MAKRAVMELFMTEEEFEQWCDEDVRAEFVDGRVIILSPEMTIDERLRWWLGHILDLYVRRKGLGEVYGPNLQVRLRPNLRRIPDLIFIRKSRLRLLQESRLEGAPDLAVEIVSKDSMERDFHDKFADYEVYGVKEYWLIVPMTKQVFAYRRGRDGKFKALPIDGGALRSRAVKGFWLKADWFWETPDVLEVLRELGILPRR